MAGRPPFAEFDADSEDIESYLERLQECFTAYDIADDEDNAAKRRAILLTSIGSNCFRVLKDLAFPDAPNTKTFAQMATLLREHFKPARLKITERYRFPFCCSATRTVHRRFLRELRKLAGTRSLYLWLAAAPLAPWMWPSNPWHRIHIDFAEDEKRHYFILVDAHSRWPQIFYMPRSTSAASTITILRELFAKYGIPVQCVRGNGPQFRSEEFTRFLKMNGVKHVRVAPYHAASKGLAERMVQSFKNHIKVCKGRKLSIQ